MCLRLNGHLRKLLIIGCIGMTLMMRGWWGAIIISCSRWWRCRAPHGLLLLLRIYGRLSRWCTLPLLLLLRHLLVRVSIGICWSRLDISLLLLMLSGFVSILTSWS